MTVDLTIREIKIKELDILKDLLYEAIYQAEGSEPLPKDIIEKPEINAYIDNFSKMEDDYCLVAIVDQQIVGAVWIRILADVIKGYGNIDNQTPEFAISLFKPYRRKGIGTLLMQKMIAYMKEKGYIRGSLSVDKDNYAVKMYQSVGFEIIKENKSDLLMTVQLN